MTINSDSIFDDIPEQLITSLHREDKNRIEGGTLYLVATPIGNLDDLSLRAIKVLSGVDFIAAEDTRNSAKLLAYLGLTKPMVSYHEHNRRERGPQIVERLKGGESCALITDAGTPAISDPGEDLVALCATEGVTVTGVPGCCAGIDALTLSGLPTARFCFEGFLSVNKNERREQLSRLAKEDRTMLLHEAPHKLRATLADLLDTLGAERRISLCRELTKRNEDIHRTTLSEAVTYYETHDPRGEYVLVIEGGTAVATEAFWQSMTVSEHVSHYIAQGMRKNDAIKAAAHDRGLPKNEIYQQVLDLN
jgi:16S rRNA (cytidine1402-2'-O)-methyltransferase